VRELQNLVQPHNQKLRLLIFTKKWITITIFIIKKSLLLFQGPQLCARVTEPGAATEPENGGDADGNCGAQAADQRAETRTTAT